MDDDGATEAAVWLYENGEWKLTEDPITWSNGDDVGAKYAEAGYSETPGQRADRFLILGLHSEEASQAAQISLYVRRDPPQCLIDIEGPTGSTRTVYAARLPDGLDLMARWAPIAQAGTLTALAGDLTRLDHRDHPERANGLLESVVRRVSRALP